MYSMKDNLLDNVKAYRDGASASTMQLLDLIHKSGSDHYSCANMYGIALKYIAELEDKLKETNDED